MKKVFLSFFAILVILVGIVFLTSEVEAGGGRGTWAMEPDGSWICKGDGYDCKPSI